MPFPRKNIKKRPGLRNLLLYRDPLWATVELTPHSVHIAGQKSEWLRETPQEIGMGDRWNGVKLAAEIPDAAFDWKEESKRKNCIFLKDCRSLPQTIPVSTEPSAAPKIGQHIKRRFAGNFAHIEGVFCFALLFLFFAYQ